MQLALKDVDLARESAGLSPLLEVVRDRLGRTVAAGHGDDDLAASTSCEDRIDVDVPVAGGPRSVGWGPWPRR